MLCAMCPAPLALVCSYMLLVSPSPSLQLRCPVSLSLMGVSSPTLGPDWVLGVQVALLDQVQRKMAVQEVVMMAVLVRPK